MTDYISQNLKSWRHLRSLYQQAADTLLAPKKIFIRWQDPPTPGSNGCASKTSQGEYVIDISENLGLDEGYRVFLHEIGHCLADEIIPSNYSKLPPDSVPRTWEEIEANKNSPIVRAREERANHVASELDSLAKAGADQHYRYGELPLHAKLRALAALKSVPIYLEVKEWQAAQEKIYDSYAARKK